MVFEAGLGRCCSMIDYGVGCGFNVTQRGLALGSDAMPHSEFWQGAVGPNTLRPIIEENLQHERTYLVSLGGQM